MSHGRSISCISLKSGYEIIQGSGVAEGELLGGCLDVFPELPILFNVNFGHTEPIGVIPYGVKCRLDADKKTLTLLEPATE